MTRNKNTKVISPKKAQRPKLRKTANRPDSEDRPFGDEDYDYEAPHRHNGRRGSQSPPYHRTLN